ncbi:MAG: hypothetical protein MMC33_006824 [Icmadophila ericetorum]|nr:hypothetical protein [Icmadophila ericetorum]
MVFGRRHHQPPVLQRTPPTSAAATAAAQAFLANRVSNGNLSSAAAAAALRSHTTSPTPVGDIQTKRMIQRQSSTSSHGSAAGNGNKSGLLRQGSSGSMTERTFREPSPNRGPSPRGYSDEPPPMPPLPKAYVGAPSIPAKSPRRPMSAEPPERISSPTPRIGGGRGVSLDRGPGVMAPPGRTGKKVAPRNISVGSFPESEGQVNQGSVNFSRPLSPVNSPPTSPLRDRRPSSPLASSPATTKSPASRPVLSDAEKERIRYQVQAAADSPVKKKKKKIVPAMTEGSHLATGTSGAIPTGTAVQSTRREEQPMVAPTPVYSTSDSTGTTASAAPVKKKKKRTTTQSEMQEPPRASYGSDSDASSEQSYGSDRPRKFNTRAAGMLTKQPSIVREDREREELEEQGETSMRNTASPVPTPRIDTNVPTTAGGSRKTSEIRTGLPSPPESIDVPPSVNTSPESSRPTSTSLNSPETGTQKRNSLSPARAARFSAEPLYATADGVKHEPPPRSVSPAKSALKHSPSGRGTSPVGPVPGNWSLSGKAPSEASDTMSIGSEEAYRTNAKSRKHVRVSFEDDSTVVGRAVSPPTSPESPVLSSPQNKGKGWFGMNKGKTTSQDEPDDSIKPMPILPSFGSVRKSRDGNETAKASPRSGKLETFNSSSDHKIGGILLEQQAYKANGSASRLTTQLRGNEPLPPEVTSVEGSGYHSDSEISSRDDGDDSNDTAQVIQKSPWTQPQLPRSTEHYAHTDSVPSIAIQPATPGIDEALRNPTEDWKGKTAAGEVSQDIQSNMPQIVEHHATDPTPATIGIAEPPATPTDSVTHIPVVAGSVADGLRQQTQTYDDNASEDDNDSIYSDAAEDLADLEGDGFGSINAIVEAPIVLVPPIMKVLSPQATPERQKTSRSSEETAQPQADEGWDKTQSYWSGLTQSRKDQLEQEATPEPAVVPPVESTTNPTKKKTPPTQEAQLNESLPQIQSTQVRTVSQSVAPPPKPALKKSMRDSQPDSPATPPQPSTASLKKSMRDFPPETKTAAPPAKSALKKSMRSTQSGPFEAALPPSSMRSGPAPKKAARESMSKSAKVYTGSPEPKAPPKTKHRPVSAVAMVDYNKSASTATYNRSGSATTPFRPLSPVQAQKPAPLKSSLRRNLSNGSDSDSSFKKARNPVTDTGRYSMRRSMRSSSVDERQRPQSAVVSRAAVLSVRSLSPNDGPARRSFSSAGPGMRTSLRSSGDFSSPRGPKPSGGKSAFGREPKTKAKAVKSPSRFSSRFGDSSDDETDDRAYQSRFVNDSSDEDEPTRLPSKFAPVRGIPKRIEEGDSTDLEDSSADEVTPRSPTVKSPTKTAASKPVKEGSALASGSMRQSSVGEPSNPGVLGGGLESSKWATIGEEKKEKRSFFSFGRRRTNSKSQVPQIPEIPSEPVPAIPRSTPTTPAKEVKEIDFGSPSSVRPQSPKTKAPKLQRRNTPKSYDLDSWPLPQSPATIDGSRPNTSNGTPSVAIGAIGRPDIGARRSTLQEPVANGVVLGKTGKKKRFPRLRKAFGLQD